MAFASSSAVGPDFDATLDKALGEAAAALPEARADVAFVFVGRPHAARAEAVPDRVRRALGPAAVIGCTAGGVIGGGREYEQAAAVSVLAGRLAGADVHPFTVTDDRLPDPDAAPSAWIALLGAPPARSPGFVVIADPFTIRADALLAGLDFAYPGAVKVGGLASGAERPGEQVLFAGDRAVRGGAVGVALTGAAEIAPAVAQGCRPIGEVARVTACEGNLLKTLDGVAAIEVVRDLLRKASERDQNLARTSLHLGFETDPFAGDAEGAWLIRNLIGVERGGGGIYVGESLRVGRRVRFHVRDRVTSAEDLERTLALAARGGVGSPDGALLFSCLGRGMHLYGVPDHDSRAFRAQFGDAPLAGFFCNGEIGPVGGATHLHGFTSSFGLIRPRATGR
jgi:small ligand-binding sensory domain FIST